MFIHQIVHGALKYEEHSDDCFTYSKTISLGRVYKIEALPSIGMLSTGMSESLTIDMHTEKVSASFPSFFLFLAHDSLQCRTQRSQRIGVPRRARPVSEEVVTAGYGSGKSEDQTVGGQAR